MSRLYTNTGARSTDVYVSPGVLFRLFRPQFPDVLFWKVLEFWRSERDA